MRLGKERRRLGNGRLESRGRRLGGSSGGGSGGSGSGGSGGSGGDGGGNSSGVTGGPGSLVRGFGGLVDWCAFGGDGAVNDQGG